MRQQSKEYIVILFIVGVLALNYPMLELFDRSWMLLGAPSLYLYLYVVWLALIILLIVVVQHSELHEPHPSKPALPDSASAARTEPEAPSTRPPQASAVHPPESP